jgi:chromosomal replication initiation ATPase DnaA
VSVPKSDKSGGHQLALDLPVEPRFGAEDFLVSPSNEAAYAMIERWPDWPAPALVIVGPPGSGKSHLAAIWAERSGARVVTGAGLALAHPPALAAAGAALVEDADRLGAAEAQLFHLMNLMRETGGALVVTAQSPPDRWGLTTPDLLSRLRLAPMVELAPPDDALMRAVLVKLLVDRQLVVDTSLIDYVALRLDRSLDAARRFVAALDREALARGRRVSRALAGDVLAAMARAGEG